ncbi:MAG: MFS transporter, partial [Planctomycetes bacterium]|nr:MFS transporter [Planctomycetota bacterium]
GSRRVAIILGGLTFLTMLPVTMMVPVLKETISVRFAASHFWTVSFMWINMVGAIVAAPLLGPLTDRFRQRRTTLTIALVINGILIWTMSQATSLPVMLSLRFLEGASHIVALSTLMALGADWAGDGRRGRMMGLLGAALMLGTSVGAPLGGILGNDHPLRVFHLGAGISVIAGVLAFGLLRRTLPRPRTARLGDSLRLLSECPGLRVAYLYAFIDRLCVGVIVSSFVLFLSDHHHLAPAQIGLMLACFMLPFALLCYPVGWITDRIGRAGSMCVGSLGFGIVYALYGTLELNELRVMMVVSGVLSAIMFAPNLAICADLAPPARRAAAYAGFNMAGSLGFMVGPLLGGIVAGPLATALNWETPYTLLFPVIGATEVLCAVLTIPWLLRLRASSDLGTLGRAYRAPKCPA